MVEELVVIALLLAVPLLLVIVLVALVALTVLPVLILVVVVAVLNPGILLILLVVVAVVAVAALFMKEALPPMAMLKYNKTTNIFIIVMLSLFRSI